MRYYLFAAAVLTITGAELQAQQRADSADAQSRHLDSLVRFAGGDTAAIRRAAVDSGWRIDAVQSFRLVGDTAWMTFTRTSERPPRDTIFFTMPMPYASNTQVLGSTARVERRNGKWVRQRSPTSPDWAAIYRAARTDTSERILEYSLHGDTAQVWLVNPSDFARPPQGEQVIHQAREVRVERRGGAWVPISARRVERRNGQWVRDSVRAKP
jgi:hypothetical protein